MSLAFAALLPHPKKLLSADKTKYPKTLAAFAEVSEKITEKKPATLVVISPRSIGPLDPFSPPPTEANAFYVRNLDKIQAFVPEAPADLPTQVFDNDTTWLEQLKERVRPFGATIMDTPQIKLDEPTSRAVMGLRISSTAQPKLLSLNLPYHTPQKLFEFGKLLGAVIAAKEEAVGLIAVGDLSSRLSTESPAGHKVEGKIFDEAVTHAAEKNLFEDILVLKPEISEAAGEDALRPLAVAFGVAHARLKSRLLSYEAPEGTGHAVIMWG